MSAARILLGERTTCFFCDQEADFTLRVQGKKYKIPMCDSCWKNKYHKGM